MGLYALYHNTTQEYNVAVGNLAGFNNSGNNNSFFGYSSGYSNTGSGNTAIGAGADVSSGNINGSTAIGAGANIIASFKAVIGNSQMSVIGGRWVGAFSLMNVSKKTKKTTFFKSTF